MANVQVRHVQQHPKYIPSIPYVRGVTQKTNKGREEEKKNPPTTPKSQVQLLFLLNLRLGGVPDFLVFLVLSQIAGLKHPIYLKATFHPRLICNSHWLLENN